MNTREQLMRQVRGHDAPGVPLAARPEPAQPAPVRERDAQVFSTWQALPVGASMFAIVVDGAITAPQDQN